MKYSSLNQEEEAAQPVKTIAGFIQCLWGPGGAVHSLYK